MKRVPAGLAVWRYARRAVCLAMAAGCTQFLLLRAEERPREILVLHSYHATFSWTEQEAKGIDMAINAAPNPPNLDFEYLDRKHFPEPVNDPQFVEYLEKKYRGIPFRVIITTDDAALDFAIENRPRLFPQASIVFCGVGTAFARKSMAAGKITGVVEQIDVAAVLDLALAIYPDIRKVIVVAESAATGRENRALVKAAEPRYGNRLQFEYPEELSTSELISLANASKPGELVLVGGFSLDRAGSLTNPRNWVQRLLQTGSRAPVFSFYDISGESSGAYLDGMLQGSTAAKMALRILNGEAVEQIPLVTNSPFRKVVNFRDLARLNVPLSRVPPGVEISNQPAPFWKLYGSELSLGLALMGLLAGAVVALSVALRHRKQAQESMLRNTEQIRLLVDNMPAGTAIVSGAGIFFNRAVTRFTGYEPGELPTLDLWFERLYGEQAAEVRKAYERDRAAGFPAKRVVPLRRKDGEIRQFEFEGFLASGREGWLMNDVTEQLEAEARLRRSQFIIENSIDGVLWSDDQGRILAANQAICALHGYSPQEFQTLTVFDVDVNLPKQRWFDGWERFAKAGSMRMETRHRRKSGDTIPVEITAIHTVSEGRQFLCAFVRDIRDRKLSEEALSASEARYRLISENMSDLVFLLGLDGNLIYVSPAVRTILGVSQSDLMGRRFEGLHPDPAGAAQWANLIREAAARDAAGPEDLPVRKANGEERWVETTLRKIPSPAGMCLLGVSRDVTDRRNAGEVREKLEEQLRHAHKMEAMGIMAGGIAHDFNNILTSILGNAELARQTIGDGPGAENLRAIHSGAIRARDLVAQILAFSRKQSRRREPVMLEMVIREVLPLVRAMLPASLDFRARFENVGATVMGDPGQIHQVLINLLTNAWQATRGAGSYIDLSLEKVEVASAPEPAGQLTPGTYACIRAADDGCGIDAAHLDKIFDPFFTTKGPGEGTGLGLSVVHGIVSAHGGFIDVQSAPGAGSTFRVYLPVIPVSAVVPLELAPQAITPATGQLVYVVDDEPAVCQLTGMMLERSGYRTRTFESPIEALHEFSSDPSAPAAVVTDLTMPNMSGVELAHLMRSLRDSVPVILTSGNAGGMTSEEARKLGFTAFLPKPFTMEALLQAVRPAVQNGAD